MLPIACALEFVEIHNNQIANDAQDQESSSASDSSVESGADAEDMQCSDTSDESDVAIKHEDSDSHGVSASVLASFRTEAIMHCPLKCCCLLWHLLNVDNFSSSLHCTAGNAKV